MIWLAVAHVNHCAIPVRALQDENFKVQTIAIRLLIFTKLFKVGSAE